MAAVRQRSVCVERALDAYLRPRRQRKHAKLLGNDLEHGLRQSRPCLSQERMASRPAAAGGAFAAPPVQEKMTSEQKRELHSVNVALGANTVIFLAKLAAWFASGGSALLAEAVHSLADIGNQALLRLGILKTTQKPTAEHPYGHLREKFIFSLISAVGIFCLGAGVTLVNGVYAIMEPSVSHDLGWGLAVLCLSAVVEGYTLIVAVRAVIANAAAAQLSFLEFIQSGRDPVSVAIMAEDGAAVAGVVIAGICTKLVQVTGCAVWDGIGSLMVALLLAGVAVYLIERNRSFLIGRSMNSDDFLLILRHLRSDLMIKNIYEARSEEIGEGIYRFSAEIDFDGPKLAERYLARQDISKMRQDLMDKCDEAADKDEDFTRLMKGYGAGLVSAVGSEVDRIESEIMRLVPGVKYVDLETDRGRFSSYAHATVDGALRSIDDPDMGVVHLGTGRSQSLSKKSNL